VFVTGGDGLDECSISTYTDVIELMNGNIFRYKLTPEEVGLKRGSLKDIQVSSVEESADLIEKIFSGKANKTAENIVILNSATALYIADEVETIKEGVEKARNTLSSGMGLRQLQLLQIKKEGLLC
jgi:anthranilate phosphoribosyltransferase